MSLQIIHAKGHLPKPVPTEPYLNVSEFFCDTIQGEGINTGQPAAFLRFQGCSQNCRWCDSKEVWKNGSPYSINEILTRMDMFDLPTKLFNGQHLVFTGGSPLKQQKGLLQFILAFSAAYGFIPFIEIENECVIDPLVDLIPYINVWNNSPKLSNSGNPDHIRYQPELIKRMARLQNSYFKFVIAQKEDWEEIERDFLKPNLIKKSQIILMPLGDTKKAVLKSGPRVAEMAIENGVRFINREHVILWDKRTGV